MLTFFGGFIPIIGAFVVGALAVLVALVSNGPTTALIVVGLIFLVQQIEGNVLQPILQGKSLALHPAVVLLVVTAGGSLFGIAGAFFSVPLAAVTAVVVRYLGEVVEARTGEPATGPGQRRHDDRPRRPSRGPATWRPRTAGRSGRTRSGPGRLRPRAPPRAPERAGRPRSGPRGAGRRRRRPPPDRRAPRAAA